MNDANSDYQDNSNAAKVAAKAPPRPAYVPPVIEDTAPPTVFASRGVCIEKNNQGPVTLGELRTFVAAAEGLDSGLPLLIQAWTDNRNGDEYFAKIEIMDQEIIDA